jgi:hypothetical protein
LENWEPVIPWVADENLNLQEVAVPMVSFCDLPLSQIGKHAEQYGYYAIGLRKEWGVKNKICPVLYTYEQSGLSGPLQRIIGRALKNIDDPKLNEFKDIFLDWFKFIRFVKPYEGDLWRGSDYLHKKIRFYDEREWRFCPDIPIVDNPEEDHPTAFLSKKYFLNTEHLQRANSALKKFKLSFEPRDIKYIIVNKENDILGMINTVRETKSKYSYDDVQILTTRIISMEHVFEDF